MQTFNEFNQPMNFKVENWRPIEKKPIDLLVGQFCYLEALNISQHAEKLFNAIQEDNPGDSWTYLPYGPFVTLADFNQWLETTIADKKTKLYAILDKQTRQPVGIAGYLRMKPEHGSIEVGHLHFSKKLKRTPLATEAMYLMMKHIFEELGYRRYEWKCNSLNYPSRDAALRFGFTYEGTFRQSNVFKNYNRDTDWFSIIDSEWPTLKIKFEKWLSPNNFDVKGYQIVKLKDCVSTD